ncbi:protein unc-13 homolog C-like [Hydra vulgaris]|uniref:Protein unc-13 homolog C-like n=1 Tax=Hydra vulgaris TaxID=6087 RepID=A0ABM4BMQ3_HYDVU
MAVTISEIRNMFKEMFAEYKKDIELLIKQQEENVLKVISANAKITSDRQQKTELNIIDSMEKIKSLEKDVFDIKESLNFHEELIEKKIKNNIESIEKERVAKNIAHKNIEFTDLKNKLREIEDRSRRNNLRINGLKENENETWMESETKVIKVFEQTLGVKNVKIERAHRCGCRDAKKPRTIMIKLLDYKDIVEILKNSFKLKGESIFINEDFCYETNVIRKELRERMKTERQLGKFAYISYDKLIVRDWVSKKPCQESKS